MSEKVGSVKGTQLEEEFQDLEKVIVLENKKKYGEIKNIFLNSFK